MNFCDSEHVMEKISKKRAFRTQLGHIAHNGTEQLMSTTATLTSMDGSTTVTRCFGAA